MCGIAGYIGSRNSIEVVHDKLKRLAYRGYDSAGVVYLHQDNLNVVKKAGKLEELGKLLKDLPESYLAIGHSRWATHGAPTDLNAHPHYDELGQVAIIHNGIIENYLELKSELIEDDHTFHSETDTEVAAHIIGREYAKGLPLEEAIRKAVKRFRGAYAIVAISRREPSKIVAVRNASPIVLGLGENEQFIASDIPALLPYTRDMVILEDNRIAVLTTDCVRILNYDGVEVPYKTFHVDWDISAAEKGGYAHFMHKEIHEQPQVVCQSIAGRIDETNRIRLEHVFSENVWSEIDRICIIGCGTAYHAGLVGKYLLENLLHVPVDVYRASEFRYGNPLLSSRILVIAISQSGETADTLAAVRLCKERHIRTLGIVNVVGSSIARECDKTIFIQAGAEVSVASTKAYTAQVLVLTLLMLYIAQVRAMPGVNILDIITALKKLPDNIEELLKHEEEIIRVAEKIKDSPLFFYCGRGIDYYATMEGALKLKEIAYIPTQEIPAGELKHGPLALIEPGVVMIVSAAEQELREKLISNIKEVEARGGTVVAITNFGDGGIEKVANYVMKFPQTQYVFLDALLSTICMQLLAYHIARLKGCEIDQPRNLAKSVTVE